MNTSRLHRIIVLLVFVAGLASIGVWIKTRDRLPDRLRIATAVQGGLYHAFAHELQEHLERRTGRQIELIGTEGTLENRKLLLAGEVDLAILQSACAPLSGLAILAPLYPEVVHVISRRGPGAQRIEDLRGHRIAIGLKDSGMRISARQVLDHYRIDVAEVDAGNRHFVELLDAPDLHGAIATTGLDNPDLMRVLASGEFELLPIEDARAISIRNPLLQPFTIPRGLYYERPPVPAQDLASLATIAVIAAAPDCNDMLVEEVLGALYEEDLRAKYPMMIAERDALEQSPVSLHPEARRFLDPYGRLGFVSMFVEALAGLKELLVGLAALAWLAWDKVRSLRSQQQAQQLQVQKDRLDDFLQSTMTIERKSLGVRDRATIEEALAKVTDIKHEALEELTDEELRGDRMFSIFLMQCSDLTGRLQRALPSPDPESSTD